MDIYEKIYFDVIAKCPIYIFACELILNKKDNKDFQVHTFIFILFSPLTTLETHWLIKQLREQL